MDQIVQLGRYRVEARLGSGAYADVYKATDTTLKRTVALKDLKPALLVDEDAFARFIQEAQVAAGLFHPHIATVLDLGEVYGRYFLAMRYVEGASLDQVLKVRGSLPWDEAIRITSQIAEALDFAHQQGLVDRDVKPQNILVSPKEGAVLTDFGLVRAMEASGLITRTGAIIGTPQYIPPEVWKGQAATPASDQYALASVLVEMLTGKGLFDAPTPPAVMLKHFEPLALPSAWPAGTEVGLEAALREALEQQPGERHASCGAFIQALQAQPAPKHVEVAQVAPIVLAWVVEALQSSKPAAASNQMSIRLAEGVEMVFMRVPAGEFWMGSESTDKEAYVDEKPQHKLYLKEYWIGKYPVTNAQYQAFIQATGYHCNGKFASGKEQHPATNVNWRDALKFCEWASRASGEPIRLPTEAEWEKAARGPDRRRYPWGNQLPRQQLCNYGHETLQVGKYSPHGDSPYGCADLSSNVWEWTTSLFLPYPYQSNDGREHLAETGLRVVRGGACIESAGIQRVAIRGRFDPSHIGKKSASVALTLLDSGCWSLVF
jgi:formylglycine-generating enzyme required for sulfatase activity